MFATTAINTASLACWMMVGALVGTVWGRMLRRSRLGLFGYAVVGTVGGAAGGTLFGLTVQGERFWGSVPVAFVASLTLVMAVRAAFQMRRKG